MNTPDQSVPTQTAPDAGGHAAGKYEPAVGDVIEFEYRNKKWTGICFNPAGNLTLSVDLNFDSGDKAWAYLDEISNVRFVKHSGLNLAERSIDWKESSAIAKAYFSKPAFKVGDMVTIAKRVYNSGVYAWISQMDEYIGFSGKIKSVYRDYAKVEGADVWQYPLESLELVTEPVLTGSYEERQAQAIDYYEWKVGDKVKITQPNTRNQDGSITPKHSQEILDRYGSIGTIYKIEANCIKLLMENNAIFLDMPYFCLESVK